MHVVRAYRSILFLHRHHHTYIINFLIIIIILKTNYLHDSNGRMEPAPVAQLLQLKLHACNAMGIHPDSQQLKLHIYKWS